MHNTKKVCERLDIVVLHGGPCFALGQHPELAAGLRGFTVTPYFSTIDELELFCTRHLERFLSIKEDEPAPDATLWE